MKRNYLIKILLHEIKKCRVPVSYEYSHQDMTWYIMNADDQYLLDLYLLRFGEDFNSTYYRIIN